MLAAFAAHRPTEVWWTSGTPKSLLISSSDRSGPGGPRRIRRLHPAMRRRAARRTGGCRAQLRNPATGLARVLHSISLNAMATPAARLPGPLVTRCRSRAVAKVDSIGLVVRRWIQCRSSSRGDDGGEGRATQRCGSPTRISSRLLGRSCCCEWVGIRVSTDTGQGALPSGGHDPLSSWSPSGR